MTGFHGDRPGLPVTFVGLPEGTQPTLRGVPIGRRGASDDNGSAR